MPQISVHSNFPWENAPFAPLARVVLNPVLSRRGRRPAVPEKESRIYEKVSLGIDCSRGGSSADEPERTSTRLLPPLLGWLSPQLGRLSLRVRSSVLAPRILVRRILEPPLLGLGPWSGSYRRALMTGPYLEIERAV